MPEVVCPVYQGMELAVVRYIPTCDHPSVSPVSRQSDKVIDARLIVTMTLHCPICDAVWKQRLINAEEELYA